MTTCHNRSERGNIRETTNELIINTLRLEVATLKNELLRKQEFHKHDAVGQDCGVGVGVGVTRNFRLSRSPSR
jgi:hypothetical protein